ncbi:ribonuclease H-like domain-containing protein [Tanacetum coccineum]
MAKEAWDILAEIFNDNKRSRSIALKAELRSLKLGDLSTDAYFHKIESIATILASLGSPISKDDIVNISLDGSSDNYADVSDIIIHREPFPDLKTVRSMLATEEMRLKSKAQATSLDSSSSSPMVLIANSGNNNARHFIGTSGTNNGNFLNRRVLLRCDSTGDPYPVTKPSHIPRAFLTSQNTWHQSLGHPGSEVLRRVLSSNSILCNKEKPLMLCYACQLGKHASLPFVSSSTLVQSSFDIVHSDLWTAPTLSLSGFKYYVLFLDHYSLYVWVYR